MTDSLDKLRKAVFAELEVQRQRPRVENNNHQEKLLGDFLSVALKNLRRSRADFARILDIEQELAEAILDGILPVSEIDDEFLADIAIAVDYEPNVLRALVGRKPVRASGEEAAIDDFNAAKRNQRGSK